MAREQRKLAAILAADVVGYSRDTLPPELKKAPFVAKPMTESELIDTARSTY